MAGRLDDLDDRDILYVSGSEFAPDDPNGQDSLTVREDDTFALENRFQGERTTWAGTLAPGTYAALVRLLEEAGFPQVPLHKVPAGSAIRDLYHAGQTAMVAWNEAPKLPGWAELFEVLDELVDAGSEGTRSERVASVERA